MQDQNKEKFVSHDECLELANMMNKKYRLALGKRVFKVSASHDDSKVLVKVLLNNEDMSFYYPVEARILYRSEEIEAYDAALFLIDYIDTYFEEFLLEEEEDLFLTIDWSDHEYEGLAFQVRGQIKNKKLEQMANELLGEPDI